MLMDLEKEVEECEPQKLIVCSGLSGNPPPLVTNDREVNIVDSSAQPEEGIVISHKKGAMVYLSQLYLGPNSPYKLLYWINRIQHKRNL